MPGAKPERRGPSFPLLFGAAMTLLCAFLYWKDPGGLLHEAESKWGDVLFRMRGTVPGFPKLQIVAVDDYSIGMVGPFPWKRGVHAQIVRKLARLGVKTIAFDVLFLDKNPDDPQGDAELAKATREAGNVIHLVAIDQVHGNSMVARPGVPGLAEASALLAHPRVEETLDRDGVLRRTLLYDFSTDQPYPLLGSALWLHYVGHKMDDLGDFPEVLPINYRGRVVMPTAETRTTPWGAFHFVHAASLFPTHIERNPPADLYDLEHDSLTEAERENFRGGIALIGSTAVGAFDHYPSSFDSSTPGVIVHANVFDNLLRGDYLRAAPRGLTAVLVAALVWASVWLIRIPAVTGASVAGGLLLLLALVDYALFRARLRLDFVAPATTFLASYGGLMVHKVIVEGREKRWIKNTFSQYLSPKVVDALVTNPKLVKLGGEKRDMSIFFLDIAHFTNISEKLDPEALTLFLNEYLSALTDVILKYDGVVDKFIGDCIMAFWNAPVDQPRHRELACLAAVECQRTVARLNQEFIKGDFPEMPAIRIGLNAGDMVVGNMGSRTRFSYTVIGDEVNLASRLEGANKFFGSHIMASEAVAGGVLDKLEARELGRVRVVGKAVPIQVYELLSQKGGLPAVQKQALDLYNEGIGYYKARQFDAALERFGKAAELTPDDKVVKIYRSSSEDYSVIPPGEDWDGVFNLTSK